MSIQAFVLGAFSYLNLVITNNKSIAKEHVSFVHDISGVNIIPIENAHVLLNNNIIIEPEILTHNDKITIGESLFIYQDYQGDTALKRELSEDNSLSNEIIEKSFVAEDNKSLEKESSLITYLDRLFMCF
jgi:hypothetical protein